MAYGGLRVSEVLALTWKDVDFDAGMLAVHGTKTALSDASVPMILPLVAELRAHRARQQTIDPDALVFHHKRHAVLRAIYVAGDAIGLNTGEKRVGCHDLRHSCAGLLLAAGVPAPRVAAIMRHADVFTFSGTVGARRCIRPGMRPLRKRAGGYGGARVCTGGIIIAYGYTAAGSVLCGGRAAELLAGG